MSVIQQLIKDGVLKVYIDARSGCLNDYTNNVNVASASASFKLNRNGVYFDSSTSGLVIADNAALRITSGSLIVYMKGGFQEHASGTVNRRFISKRDAGGTMWDFVAKDSGTLSLYDGTTTAELATTILGKKYIGVNFANGEAATAYTDGVLAGTFGAASTIVSDDANISIGRYYGSGDYQPKCTISAILIANRNLTDLEHAQLYGELDNMSFTTKLFSAHHDDYQFKTEFGGYESPAVITSGEIENTPFRINSGSWALTYSTHTYGINNNNVKIIACAGAGSMFINLSDYMTEAEAASGSFEFYIQKGAASIADIYFCLDDVASPTQYLLLRIDASEAVLLQETGAEKWKTANGYFSTSTYQKIKINWSALGEITVEINDTAIDITGGSGSYPYTTAINTNKYLLFDFDPSDSLVLGSLNGDYSLIKRS